MLVALGGSLHELQWHNSGGGLSPTFVWLDSHLCVAELPPCVAGLSSKCHLQRI